MLPRVQQTFQRKIEQQRIVHPDFLQQRHCGRIEQTPIRHVGRREQRHDAGQGIVGTIEQARMPVSAPQYGLERPHPIELRQRRNIGMQFICVARFVHHAGEQFVTAHTRTIRALIDILVVAIGGAVGDDYPHTVIHCPAQAQWIAEILIPAQHRQLAPGMADDGHIRPCQCFVKPVAAW